MAARIFQFGIVFTLGFCFCSASGNAGAAQSGSEIALSLNVHNPKDVIIGRGQSATLRCEVNSSVPGLTVSWLYEGKLISVNDSRKQVLKDGSLLIQKVVGKKMEGVEGQYRCLVKNSVGAILSNPSKLTIATIGREFIDEPEDLQVTEQQPVVIPCRLQSTPKAVIHWERDNKPLPQSTRYVPLPTGALLITSTHTSDAGLYRCIATNSILSKKNKTKQSKIGQLVVLPSSNIIESPKLLPLGLDPNFTVVVGNNLTLYCAVTGWPTPIIQWLNNMSMVVGNSSVLELQNVKEDAAGLYSCSAFNSGGRTTMHFGVEVVQAPEFNIVPVSTTFPAAKTIRLDCQAKGIPQPKIHWLKNGEMLHTGGRIKKQQTGLVLSHSFISDAGIYQCIAVNSVGTAWTAAQLTPYFTQNLPSPPQNLQCQSYDNNSICLTWNAPSNTTIQAYSVYAFNGEKVHDFVTNYTYYLANGLDEDTNYTLYVRSYSTQASDQSDNVACKTGTTNKRNTQVEYVSETTVKLFWNKLNNDAPCGIVETLYKVQWKRNDQSAVTVEHTNSLTKTITGLRPSSTYEFRVQSLNNDNDNTTWISFRFSSDKSIPDVTTPTSYANNSVTIDSLIPQQLEAITLSPYSINLTWFDVGDQDDVFYSICYLEVKGTKGVSFKGDKSCEKGELLKSETNFVEIKKLKPNTLYEFKVRSQNYQGLFSPYSHTVEVKMPTDVPSSVQDLKYAVINTTTVCLRWRTPVQRNGEIKKYVVSYTPDQNWPLQLWNNIDVLFSPKTTKSCWPDTEDTITVLLRKLKPNLYYTVIVRAETEAGLGNPTVPITFATKESITGNYYPDFENSIPSQATNEDINYKQKLGIALGISISLICILCCISCALFKKRCAKRQAMAQARLATSSNYYPPPGSLSYPGTALQLRQQDTCIAEAHEMQHLVSDQNIMQEPIFTPTQVDTKARGDFPNGQLNGSAKFMNGHIANGHVHITENPRYEYHQCNGSLNPKKVKRGKMLHFSNKAKSSSLEHPHSSQENEEVNKISDYNSNCNSDILQQMYVNSKLQNSSEVFNASSRENSLNNITQVSCLDDLLYTLPVVHRRSSPALSPNG